MEQLYRVLLNIADEGDWAAVVGLLSSQLINRHPNCKSLGINIIDEPRGLLVAHEYLPDGSIHRIEGVLDHPINRELVGNWQRGEIWERRADAALRLLRFKDDKVRRAGELPSTVIDVPFIWGTLAVGSLAEVGENAELIEFLQFVGPLISIGIQQLEQREPFRGTIVLRQVLKSTTDYISVVDRQGTIHYINHTMAPWSIRDTIGTCIYDWVVEGDRAVARACIARVFATGEPGAYESKVEMPGGDITWFAVWITAIERDGAREWATLVVSDISERKRAESQLNEVNKALNKERQQLLALLSSMGEAVVATDSQGRVILLNRMMEEWTAWPRERVHGRALDEVCQLLDARTGQAITNLLGDVLSGQENGGLPSQTLLVGRHGQERFVSCVMAPILNEDGESLETISKPLKGCDSFAER